MHSETTVIQLIKEEVAAGFPHLSGARVTGTLRVTQAALDGELRRLRNLPLGLTLDVHGDNRIVAHYGVLRATAVIAEDVPLGDRGPRLQLVLTSALVALALRAVVRTPAIAIHGRAIAVDIAALDRGRAQQPYWALLRRARLRTTPGQIHIEFEAAV
jgi:hypothetical protein